MFPTCNNALNANVNYLKVSNQGENSQIPCFGKICGKLALFWKYLAICQFFSIQVSQNRVLNSTRVS